MLKTERSREDEDDLMIWVSRVSHTGSWVHHDDDLGDGGSGLSAKYGSSNSRSLGLVNTLGVEHQRRERVRQHHLLKRCDFQEEFKENAMMPMLVMLITVKRRAQRASLLLSIIPWVVKDSNIGSGDPEHNGCC